LNRKEKPSLSKTLKRVTFAGIENWLSGKFLRRDRSEIVVILAILGYTLVFSYFTILKFTAFSTYAWDLGIFDQSFWSTAHAGKFFFSTVEQFISPSGSFFGTHFSPVLFLVLPFYYVASSPQTLLVSQSLILALGAIPLYFFAKNVLKSKTMAVVFSLVYLIYPPLQGINWFDFHAQAFLPVFFFSAFYFLYKEKWPQYFLFIFLSLAVAENVPITVVFIGLYCLWRFRRSIFQAVKSYRLTEPKLLVPVVTIVFALVWSFLVGWYRQVYYPVNPDFTQLYKAVDNWSVLGLQGLSPAEALKDPNALPFFIITHPDRAFTAFITDFPLKFLYLMLLFGPIIFLSIRSSIAVISLAWLVPALFSNYSPYYTIGDQFPAYIVAFLFMAAVEGVRKNSRPIQLPNLASYAKLLLLGSILFTIAVSPLSPAMSAIQGNSPYFSVYHVPTVTRHDRIEQQIADLVPTGASILTINNIFPHFSSRLDAYAYPLPRMVQMCNGAVEGSALYNYIEGLFAKSQFVMTDNQTNNYTTDNNYITDNNYTTDLILSTIWGINYNTTMIQLGSSGLGHFSSFRLYAYGDGVFLIEKGYTGEPLNFDK
jgi:uncharacterized membrane protein